MPLCESRFPGDAQRFLYDQHWAGEQLGRGGVSWALLQPCLLLPRVCCQTSAWWGQPEGAQGGKGNGCVWAVQEECLAWLNASFSITLLS